MFATEALAERSSEHVHEHVAEVLEHLIRIRTVHRATHDISWCHHLWEGMSQVDAGTERGAAERLLLQYVGTIRIVRCWLVDVLQIEDGLTHDVLGRVRRCARQHLLGSRRKEVAGS